MIGGTPRFHVAWKKSLFAFLKVFYCFFLFFCVFDSIYCFSVFHWAYPKCCKRIFFRNLSGISGTHLGKKQEAAAFSRKSGIGVWPDVFTSTWDELDAAVL